MFPLMNVPGLRSVHKISPSSGIGTFSGLNGSLALNVGRFFFARKRRVELYFGSACIS